VFREQKGISGYSGPAYEYIFYSGDGEEITVSEYDF
jgi:hypothetical protein